MHLSGTYNLVFTAEIVYMHPATPFQFTFSSCESKQLILTKHLMLLLKVFCVSNVINPLSANPTKWSNKLKQFVDF